MDCFNFTNLFSRNLLKIFLGELDFMKAYEIMKNTMLNLLTPIAYFDILKTVVRLQDKIFFMNVFPERHKDKIFFSSTATYRFIIRAADIHRLCTLILNRKISFQLKGILNSGCSHLFLSKNKSEHKKRGYFYEVCSYC